MIIRSQAHRRESWTVHFLANYSVTIGLVLRLFLAWCLPYFLDNERFIPGVAYTDIDFHVFSDAAAYVQQGDSPYRRTTYRYTPFLATLLATLPSKEAGRYLFCVADALCGWIIVVYRQRHRVTALKARKARNEPTRLTSDTIPPELQQRLLDAAWWLYNPLPINICTRGSAESLVVLLPVLATLWVATTAHQGRYCLSAVAAGLCHGVAMHAKLYPVIYTLSFMTRFVPRRNATAPGTTLTRRPWYTLLWRWIQRLVTPAPIVFAATSVLTFVALTYAAVAWYGTVALDEGLLYHFSRVDHRHNYSMHWYWIYLARDRALTNMVDGSSSASHMAWTGRILLLPQLILLAYTSLGVAPHNLSLALFVQTFVFVAHNKVITAQYFTWYLCLLPLCEGLSWTHRVRRALVYLGVSVALWLASAYCLEMQGMAVHRIVWMASLLFFAANVNLLGALLASTRPTTPQPSQAAKKDW